MFFTSLCQRMPWPWCILHIICCIPNLSLLSHDLAAFFFCHRITEQGSPSFQSFPASHQCHQSTEESDRWTHHGSSQKHNPARTNTEACSQRGRVRRQQQRQVLKKSRWPGMHHHGVCALLHVGVAACTRCRSF